MTSIATTQTPLTDLSLADAATAIAARDFSPTELVEQYLDRLDQVNPEINAYVEITRERARDDAARATKEIAKGNHRGPLHGIPIGLKDLVDTAGITTAGGTAIYRERVPKADATVAQRLRDAGSVLLGKTNTHELALGVTTNNPHFGPTRNPWDQSRVPGGSSGGSGAAVAARLAAAAIGTDTGGSVRIPASFCGCVGLKPTYGLVSKSGVLPLSHLADHVGPLTRTVEDAALVLQAIAGYDPTDSASVPVAIPDYRAALTGDIRGLRIGVPRSTMWALLDDEVRVAAEVAVVVLAELGATVVDVELPDHTEVAGMPGSIGFLMVALAESKFADREAWTKHPELFGPDIAFLYSLPDLTGPMIAESLERGYAYTAALRTTLTDVDLLVSPTVPMAAPAIGDEMVTIAGIEIPVIAAGVANTIPYNIARLPAISVPCGFTSAGLPVGLQLAGRPFDEATVLRAAHAYEQARRLAR